jgi:hypothetical protein
LVATSDKRVVYVLDAKTLEVKHRLWNQAVVEKLRFNKTGSRLVITDDARRLRFLDTAKWECTKEFEDISSNDVDFAPEVDLLVMAKGDKLFLRTMADGEEKGQAALPEGFSASAVSLSPDGGRSMAICSGLEGREAKLERDKWPKEFKNELDREEFEQKHDGKHSRIVVHEWPAGKASAEQETWYRLPQDPVFHWRGKGMVVACYHGPWAEIDAGGKAKLFEAPAWCSYGVGWSPAGDVVYSGSLAEYVQVRNGKPPVKVELARELRLPGWPEYFCGFGIEADGSGYGVTLDDRVARIGKDGQLLEIKPFF